LKRVEQVQRSIRGFFSGVVALAYIDGYTLDLAKTAMILIFSLLFVLGLPLYTVLSGQVPLGRDYRTADRASAGIAPPAETTAEAVVQVYGARALNWRGIFGVHTWIATKPPEATQYTRGRFRAGYSRRTLVWQRARASPGYPR
jgi:hypothetical protein